VFYKLGEPEGEPPEARLPKTRENSGTSANLAWQAAEAILHWVQCEENFLVHSGCSGVMVNSEFVVAINRRGPDGQNL
jgi:hypothetical protein